MLNVVEIYNCIAKIRGGFHARKYDIFGLVCQLYYCPKELGCGSGMTCWRRLRDWQEAGSWQLIHFVLLDWLARYGQIDWSRAVLDSCSIRAVFGGFKPVPIPPTERSWAANVI